MVAQFLTGVIVGLLLGLALAPILRSWILWQSGKSLREATGPSLGDPSVSTRSDR